ncbi:methyl-accepting chemotaxis protein [Massilia sp. Leaf139]|uniref:methyl-accepting chemotaxis protein n=1 Tax=Massilia sp. Leaf139 TaxID=1736272 RepID=UPI0009E89B36|nr:methyl-accepting chemotaxis protein [Massilia sp. Leaf139]
MLSRLKIGPKLLLAPGVVLVLLVLLSCGAWYAMVRQNASLEDIVGRRAAHMRAASDLVFSAQRGHAEIYQLQSWIGGSFPKSRIEPLIRDIHRQHALTTAGLQRLAGMTPPNGDERRYVDGAATAYARYIQAVRDVIELARDDQSISANAMSKAESAFADVAQRLNALSQLEQMLSQQASNSAAADFRAMTWLMPCVILLAIGVSLRITVAVRRALLSEIRGIGAAAVDLASGDLTVKDRVYGNDEIAETSRALNASIRNLNGTLRTILQSAQSIGSASRDLALGNLNLTTRAVFRANSLEHTASSMQELAATVNLTADSAQAANRLTESASNVAQQGENVADRLVTTMASVMSSACRAAEITQQIDAIAVETGTLALNAALEAARAGEHGREFALVAGEVRSLALRTGSAAREIRELINQSVAEIEGGTAFAAQAGSSMATIAESVQQVGDIINQISSASAEQASGLEEVSEAIVQMDQVTQRNTSLVEEAAEAARTLQMQALTLSRAVATFRLDEAVLPPEPPPRSSSVAEPDMREVLKDGRRDASIAPKVERRKLPRPHLRLASRRDLGN